MLIAALLHYQVAGLPHLYTTASPHRRIVAWERLALWIAILHDRRLPKYIPKWYQIIRYSFIYEHLDRTALSDFWT